MIWLVGALTLTALAGAVVGSVTTALTLGVLVAAWQQRRRSWPTPKTTEEP